MRASTTDPPWTRVTACWNQACSITMGMCCDRKRDSGHVAFRPVVSPYVVSDESYFSARFSEGHWPCTCVAHSPFSHVSHETSLVVRMVCVACVVVWTRLLRSKRQLQGKAQRRTVEFASPDLKHTRTNRHTHARTRASAPQTASQCTHARTHARTRTKRNAATIVFLFAFEPDARPRGKSPRAMLKVAITVHRTLRVVTLGCIPSHDAKIGWLWFNLAPQCGCDYIRAGMCGLEVWKAEILAEAPPCWMLHLSKIPNPHAHTRKHTHARRHTPWATTLELLPTVFAMSHGYAQNGTSFVGPTFVLSVPTRHLTWNPLLSSSVGESCVASLCTSTGPVLPACWREDGCYAEGTERNSRFTLDASKRFVPGCVKRYNLGRDLTSKFAPLHMSMGRCVTKPSVSIDVHCDTTHTNVPTGWKFLQKHSSSSIGTEYPHHTSDLEAQLTSWSDPWLWRPTSQHKVTSDPAEHNTRTSPLDETWDTSDRSCDNLGHRGSRRTDDRSSPW